MSGFANPLRWLVDYIRGAEGEDGPTMSVERSLTYAPLYYGVRRITNNFAMLPCNLMRKRNGRVDYKSDHAAYLSLSLRPNGYQTPFVYKQQFLSHAILWGDGRSYIHRGQNGPEYIPLMPDRTITGMIEGEKWHATKPVRDDRFDLLTDMRKHPEETVVLPNSDVIHLPGFTVNGVNGLSLIGLAKQSIGIGLGAEGQASKQIKKGYSGGLMLEAPPGAFRREEDAKEFLDGINKAHAGQENAGRIGLLREGVKANVLAMSNQDAQFIEQRKFQRQDVALWLGLESILGDDNSVSYNSLEQKILSYLMNCLGPWLTACEQEFNLKLLSDREQKQGYRFKFNDGALLRSDKAATAAFATAMIASRIYNPNEIRYDLFDENPYEGGEQYANPATTSGSSDDSDSSDAGQSDDDTPSTSRTNALAIKETLRSMFSREASDAINGANRVNFVDWIDKYYDKWTQKLANKLESIGLDRDLARIHCEQSREMLLNVAGESTPENLKEKVTAAVAGWKNRVNAILEAQPC